MLTMTATEVSADPYIVLDDASAHFPGRPHRATVWRWALKGIRKGGTVIRLRSIVCGNRRFTQPGWCAEFVAALNADNPSQPAPVMTATKRQRQAAAAMATLASMGVTSK